MAIPFLRAIAARREKRNSADAILRWALRHRDDFRIPSRSLTLVKETRFRSAVPRMPTPIDQRKKPVAVKIHVKSSAGVDITWADGHSSHFDFSFLRESCPCATCNDERAKKESSHAGPRLSSPLLPMYKPKPRAQSASPVGNYAIQISFSDGHSTGIFSYDYLRTQCPCEECARAFRAPAATK